MLQHHRHLLFKRRRNIFLAGKMCRYLVKNEWVAVASPAYHHKVAAGLLIHTEARLKVSDIAVSDDRNSHSFLHLTDNVNICFAAVKLVPRPPVDRYRSSSGVLKSLCHFNGIDTLPRPAAPYLDSHRSIAGSFHRCRTDLRREPDVLHQRRASTRADYLRHRTAHIYVDNIRRVVPDYPDSLRHKIGLAAEKLNAHRPLFICNGAEGGSLSVAVTNTLRRDHFAHNVSRAVFPAHKAVRSVRHACHWCERGSSGYLNSAYSECISHSCSPQACRRSCP